jgi:DNA polymerase III sliding clamp (beta) subunit (PCNA family)
MLINRTELIKSINKCSTVIGRTSTLPIIENVLIKFADKQVKVMATNLEVTMISSFASDNDIETTICIDPKPLKDFLSVIETDQVEFSILVNEDAEEEADRKIPTTARFEYGLGSEIEFPLMNPEKFPTFPQKNKDDIGFIVSGEVLKDILADLRPYVSNDEMRPTMTCVKIDLTESHIRGTATNAHVLQTINKESVSEVPTGSVNFLINKNMIQAILKMGNVPFRMFLTDSNLMIFTEETILAGTLTAGNFPNWEGAIPSDFENEIIFDKAEFIKGVNLSSLSADKSGKLIKFSVVGTKLEMITQDVETGRKGSFKMSLESAKENHEFGMTSTIIKQVLDSTPEVDHLKFKVNERRACIFGNKDATLILAMPSILVDKK